MSVQADLTGDVAKLKFDDSLSMLAIVVCLASLIAAIFLAFKSLQGVSVGIVLITPVLAAVWLIRAKPPRRTLRIDRQLLSVYASRNGRVRETKVQKFESVQILRVNVKGETLHQVRITTSDGPLLITAFVSRQRAEELATRLAEWLHVKVVDAGNAGMLSATLGCIQIWN